jgi:hypothetical protein
MSYMVGRNGASKVQFPVLQVQAPMSAVPYNLEDSMLEVHTERKGFGMPLCPEPHELSK